MSASVIQLPDRPSRIADVDDLLDAYERGFAAGDAQSLADLYTDDARWMAAAGVVFDGRAAIRIALDQFVGTVPSRLLLTEQDRFVFGHRAVSRGTYTLSSAEASGRTISGAYLNLLQNDGIGWKILGQQMNYSFPMTPEMWVGQIEALRSLPSDDSGRPVAPAFEQLFGPMPSFGDLLTPDVCAALPGRPWEVGCESVADRLVALRRRDTQLVFHDLDAWPLSRHQSAHLGWYEALDGGGASVGWGTCTLVMRQSVDGRRRIRWLVATAAPEV